MVKARPRGAAGWLRALLCRCPCGSCASCLMLSDAKRAADGCRGSCWCSVPLEQIQSPPESSGLKPTPRTNSICHYSQLFAVLFRSAPAKCEREACTARVILFILRPATTDSILPRHRNAEVRARRANITSASPARAQKRLLLSAAVPAAAPAGGYLGQAHAALAPFHSSFAPHSL